MLTERYLDQLKQWPRSGRHILGQFDAESIYVYQAYCPSIANFAVEHQRFGGDFSYSRMSWIKPNFLWMMYRSGWGLKEGQEHILSIRLRRPFFDDLLRSAVPSGYDSTRYASREQWQADVAGSNVRLQWDPDHDPLGKPVERRAVQLGLRSEALRQYGESEIVSIEDITPFVTLQRAHLPSRLDALLTPKESIYRPGDREVARALGIESL